MTSFDIITENIGENIEDVVFFGGDFSVLESDQQHIQHLLKAIPGQYYQNPLIGMGILNYRNAAINPLSLKQDIKIALKSDNYNPIKVIVSNDFKVYIDAVKIK